MKHIKHLTHISFSLHILDCDARIPTEINLLTIVFI